MHKNTNYNNEALTVSKQAHARTHTHTRLTALFPGLPGWASTRKAKPIWILLKQETVSGSGISWAMCKSAPRSTQMSTPAPQQSVFYRPDALPATQPTASKHWRHNEQATYINSTDYSVDSQSIDICSIYLKIPYCRSMHKKHTKPSKTSATLYVQMGIFTCKFLHVYLIVSYKNCFDSNFV